MLMKKRLINVLAWAAAVWSALLIVGFGVAILDGRAGPVAVALINEPSWLAPAPAIWTLLYIWTGYLRILPWRQVTNDD